MSTPDKLQYMKKIKGENKALKVNLKRYKEKLTSLLEKKGVCVDDSTETDLVKIMENNNINIINEFPEHSFQRIFWQQQMDAVKTAPRGRRWHPAFIKWCLYLRHKSAGAYELLRTTGCLQLPSQRTLRDYTHYVKSTTGFSTDVDLQLIKSAGNLKEHEKYVTLILDEMHIKEDLVYDRWTGELIGFTNLDDITSHLEKLEAEVSETADEEEGTAILANSVLTFMVRGLFIPLQFPYATFPCNATSAEQLIVLFMQAVFRVERCGLKVSVVTCDGLSANRKFFKMIGTASEEKNQNTRPKILLVAPGTST